MEIIGEITEQVRQLLNLTCLEDNLIYIGASNYDHMKSKHFSAYQQYGTQLRQILQSPDYVGQNPKDGSIEFVKEFLVDGAFVKVAVRLTMNGRYFARSLYVLNEKRVKNFIRKGSLKPLPTP